MITLKMAEDQRSQPSAFSQLESCVQPQHQATRSHSSLLCSPAESNEVVLRDQAVCSWALRQSETVYGPGYDRIPTDDLDGLWASHSDADTDSENESYKNLETARRKLYVVNSLSEMANGQNLAGPSDDHAFAFRSATNNRGLRPSYLSGDDDDLGRRGEEFRATHQASGHEAVPGPHGEPRAAYHSSYHDTQRGPNEESLVAQQSSYHNAQRRTMGESQAADHPADQDFLPENDSNATTQRALVQRRAHAERRPDRALIHCRHNDLAVKCYSRNPQDLRSTYPRRRSATTAANFYRRRNHLYTMSVLRDEEVPYARAWDLRTSLGSATGMPVHSPSTYGVNAGGYPVPNPRPSYEITREVSRLSANYPQQRQRRRVTPAIQPTAHFPPLAQFDQVAEWKRAIDLFKKENLSSSLSIFEAMTKQTVVEAVPLAKIHYNCGVLLSRIRDTKSAAAAFEKAVGLEPGLTIGWYCLGICRYLLKEAIEALRCFDQAASQFEGGSKTLDFGVMGLALQLHKPEITSHRDLCVMAFGGNGPLPRMFSVEELFVYMANPAGGPVVAEEEEEKVEEEKSVREGGRRFSVLKCIWEGVKRLSSRK